jgi:hypothetical protein
VSDIESQIQTAVQNARSSGSGNGNDRDAVKSAVDAVLQNNGVDLTKFQDAMKSAHASHRHGGKHGKDGDGDADGGQTTPGMSSTVTTSLNSLASGIQPSADAPAGTLLDMAA